MKHGEDIEIIYIVHRVYEHLIQTYSRKPGFCPTYRVTGYDRFTVLIIYLFFPIFYFILLILMSVNGYFKNSYEVSVFT